MFAALALSFTLAATPADEASAAFKRGRELMAKGRLADACAAFDESHRLDPALGALLNLAECTFKLEQHARAWAAYEEVLAWAKRTQNQPRAQVATERLATLRPKVALVLIDALPTDVVSFDRQRVMSGQTLALDPGAHAVEVKREAMPTQTRTLSVSGGQTLTFSAFVDEPPPVTPLEPAVVLPAVVAPPVVTPAVAVVTAPVAAPPPSRAGPLALLIGGGLSTVAAGIALGFSVDAWNRGEAQRLGGPLTITQAQYQLAGQLYPFSVAGLVVGPLLAAAGALWWLLSS